jgi:uncharacterized protein DUF5681
MTDNTLINQRPAHLWKPGQSGNPAGRPKSARGKLTDDFVAALYKDFTKHGEEAHRKRENMRVKVETNFHITYLFVFGRWPNPTKH